ncbi:hypothetical protein [Saccharopolyspora rhizosphaerae]|uniref:hypothetical protein n=1 Tax=Saccharopolyspora rhizosphaerae TaxID=2492662 RepID=UPI0013155086|nr:hypothetical protein [Saccharopolyspora rhizosphaerae]
MLATEAWTVDIHLEEDHDPICALASTPHSMRHTFNTIARCTAVTANCDSLAPVQGGGV